MSRQLTEAIAKEALREVVSERRAGPWMLTEPLGRGGQGQAWRALRRDPQVSLTRQVLSDDLQQWRALGDRAVIKLMLPPVAAEWSIPSEAYPRVVEALSRQFIVECDLLASVESPYVPTMYERGLVSTNAGWAVPWAAIELIEGVSLRAQLNRTGPLDRLRWLELAHDIFAALTAIHEAGLVHLDLKLDNVMLEPLGARLIDFGLAQRAGDMVGKGNAGTPGYFAPEQLDEVIEESDFASEVDMFKAGVTLARAAGRTLHDLWEVTPDAPGPVLRAAMRRPPELGALSEDQRRLLGRLLAFEPHDRGSARAMLLEIRRLLPPDSSRSADHHGDQSGDPNLSAEDSHPMSSPDDAVGSVEHTPVGAQVIAEDNFGLRWPGVVLGPDPKRRGHLLVQQHSSRGLRHVRSYGIGAVEVVNPRDRNGGSGPNAVTPAPAMSPTDLRARRATIVARLAAASGRAKRDALQRLLDRIDERLAQEEG